MELAGLWSGLSWTLTRLEAFAAEPVAALDDEALVTLSRLRYRLHAAGELALGIEPPDGSRTAHARLAAALVDARDATAEVAEAIELGGPEAAAPLVLEWRGALFRVRLASRELPARPLPALRGARAEETRTSRALAAVALVVVGTAAFALGAAFELWPVWTAGLALFAGALGAYRP